ncbi:MAG TPA: hypothetical protein VIY09_03680 [Rhizomicrobium sp.]
MRGSLLAVAVFLLAQSLAPVCLAQSAIDGASGLPMPGPAGTAHVQTGAITRLDPASMSFVCEGKGISQTYWITRATRFRAGPHRASFFDLRTGQTVQVASHDSGSLEVADLVAF